MANRNRMKMSEYLFTQLVSRAEESDISVDIGTRWVKRLNEEDSEMMSKAECQILVLSRQLKTILISYKGKCFFASFGFPNCDDIPDGLTRVEATPALFILTVSELVILPSVSGSKIKDIIGDHHKNINDYRGHDLSDITSLFPKISYFSVDTSYAMSQSIERVTGSYASRSYSSGPLMIHQVTRVRIATMFESGNEYIPFNLALQGLMSFSWQSFFIELYRCLEQLYSAPRVKDLSEEFSINRSLHDLAEALERILSWRPKEDESLLKVLRYCSKDSIDSILLCLSCEPCDDYNKASDGAAKAVYKLRNSLVHYRPTKNRIVLADNNWNGLIVSMVDLISESYHIVGKTFHSPRQ